MYWRDPEQSNLELEVQLYNRFGTDKQHSIVNMFLFFGHEIPEFGGTGYDASYPDRTFTIHDLTNGLKGFTNNSKRFDLLVLSTCYGGTPHTIGTLESFSRTIIASPGKLHLSHFDLHLLEMLDINLPDGNVPAFAKRFAQLSFNRLTEDIQTAVSIAVYDLERVREFLHSTQGFYSNTIAALQRKINIYLAKIERCDCADLPEYFIPTISEGVEVFYRPARFGRLKNKKSHSGWECLNYEEHNIHQTQTIKPVHK